MALNLHQNINSFSKPVSPISCLAVKKQLLYKSTFGLYCRSDRRWAYHMHKMSLPGRDIRLTKLENQTLKSLFVGARRKSFSFSRAAPDDYPSINGTSGATSMDDIEDMRAKLNQSLQDEDSNGRLIQSIHDAARIFELAIKENSTISKIPWFSKTWLGGDKNAWVKTLSYQAAVNSLLQATCEIASRGEGRDRNANVFVERSLLRLSAPLEDVIKKELSSKEASANEWLWSQQIPAVMSSLVHSLEANTKFSASTVVNRKGTASSFLTSDISLLKLSLSSVAAITKLGPVKISCPQFFALLPDITGRLMEMLVNYVPMDQTYQYMKEIGLRREFLIHFGPRVAACCGKSDRSSEEITFWLDLIQKQLQRAIDREKIWSRLTTSESIEVLEKDLAIFGFFIALGRATQSYISANKLELVDDALEDFLRFLISGSVLYYPQLASISSYQLYVEVVCEELEWLPFYPKSDGISQENFERDGRQTLAQDKQQIMTDVMNICSYWIQSFIKYSAWLGNPYNVKAANYLARGHHYLEVCKERLGHIQREPCEGAQLSNPNTSMKSDTTSVKEMESFDEALQSVEEALARLEELLKDLHVSSSSSGKEHLEAACSDLERIRKLKKEAEFLEASFRAKAASLQEDESGIFQSPANEFEDDVGKRSEGKKRGRLRFNWDGQRSNGLWSYLIPRSRKVDHRKPREDLVELESSESLSDAAQPNEIYRFRALRRELIQLEERVQRSSAGAENDLDEKAIEETSIYHIATESPEASSVRLTKKEDIIGQSIDKLKEAGMDVWQGTQLLATDVGAAVVLLKRSVIGDSLTEKEKKALQRTVTDLASVIPIGILMLLPVTAVGHAAILAAIQRYAPAMIPSSYGSERLSLLRQLEKVRELEKSEPSSEGAIELDNFSGNTKED